MEHLVGTNILRASRLPVKDEIRTERLTARARLSEKKSCSSPYAGTCPAAPRPPHPLMAINLFVCLSPDDDDDSCAGCPEYYSSGRFCCMSFVREDPPRSVRARRIWQDDPGWRLKAWRDERAWGDFASACPADEEMA